MSQLVPPSDLSPDELEALKEQYRRSRARTSLTAFAQYTFPGFKIGPHHPIGEGTLLLVSVLLFMDEGHISFSLMIQ